MTKILCVFLILRVLKICRWHSQAGVEHPLPIFFPLANSGLPLTTASPVSIKGVSAVSSVVPRQRQGINSPPVPSTVPQAEEMLSSTGFITSGCSSALSKSLITWLFCSANFPF